MKKIEKYGFFKANVNSTNKLKVRYKHKIIKTRKTLKTLKNHKEKMSIHVNVRMSKIMRTPIKVGVRRYAMYANCRTQYLQFYRHNCLNILEDNNVSCYKQVKNH